MGPKVKAASLLFAMYGLGILTGTAWDIYRSHHHTHTMFADRRIIRLKKELNLSPWQEQVLREIVQDARDRAQDINDAVNFDLAQIHEDSLEAIQQLLTPEQRQRFDNFHKKSHAKQLQNDYLNPPPEQPGKNADEEVSTS